MGVKSTETVSRSCCGWWFCGIRRVEVEKIGGGQAVLRFGPVPAHKFRKIRIEIVN